MQRYLLAGIAIASLNIPVFAVADTINAYSATLDQSTFLPPDGIASVGVAQFNSSLGTLTDATLTLDVFSQPQFEVYNYGTIDGTGTGSTIVTYSVKGVSASASTGLRTVTAAAGDLASSTPKSVFSTAAYAFPTLSLAALVGPGTLFYDVSQLFTTSGTSDTPGALLAFGGTASSNYSLAMTYDYTPVDPASVPEPSAIVLFSTGVLGIGAFANKRRRKLA